jgi:hypothetical protein
LLKAQLHARVAVLANTPMRLDGGYVMIAKPGRIPTLLERVVVVSVGTAASRTKVDKSLASNVRPAHMVWKKLSLDAICAHLGNINLSQAKLIVTLVILENTATRVAHWSVMTVNKGPFRIWEDRPNVMCAAWVALTPKMALKIVWIVKPVRTRIRQLK